MKNWCMELKSTPSKKVYVYKYAISAKDFSK